MARTNDTDVQAVFDTSIGDTTPHIEAATELVDEIAEKSPETKASRLTKIEKFYAAHLATAQDPRASSQSGASRSIDYSEENTNYEQIAISLDPTNVIANAGKPNATVSVPDAKGLRK